MIHPFFPIVGNLLSPKCSILKKIFTWVLVISPLLLSVIGRGQDMHFTQFYKAPFLISPGLAGAFYGDTRFMASYRRQWFSVPQVNFETFSAAVDLKLWPDRINSRGYFALAFSANRDQAGTSRLSLLKADVNGSYTRSLSDRAFFSFGVQGSFNQRRFDIGNLSFNEQYRLGTGYDPSLPTGETRFNGTNAFFSLSAGLNFRVQTRGNGLLVDNQRHRSKLDIGFGLFNLNRPSQSFADADPVRLPLRYSAYVLSVIQVKNRSNNLDLVFNAMGQSQQEYFELVGMFGLKYHLSRFVDSKKAVQLSAAIRFGDQPLNYLDGIAPVLDFFIADWQIGFSYDINLSPFKASTRGDSGIEFSLRRGITKVRLRNPRPYIIL